MRRKDEGSILGLDRRDFLKLGAGASLAACIGGFLPERVKADKELPQSQKISEYLVGKKIPSVCNFCGVGCGVIGTVVGGRVVEVEGNPYHPINEGTLCSKGQALFQMRNIDGKFNSQRVTEVMYRAPNDDRWQKKNWDWAIAEIAERIKETRDLNWVERDEDDYIVNRTEAVASLGSVFINSEECYALSKALRALGIVYMENEARICASSAVAALGETLGRGAMTNHWIDLGNSDCIMIIGANPAETFVNGFKWILKAREKGAKCIHVDPRYTRTSAKADVYAMLRTGTDIAFVGGMINYVIQNNLYFEEYVKEYTDASFLVKTDYEFDEGLFSGYDAAERIYDKSTWQYQVDETDAPKMDMSLQDPNCVFQLLKNHFSRYDVDTVCEITGTPKDVYLEVCQTYVATGQRGKAGAIVFSAGTDQHSQATQMVRSYTILQLLLGNIGVSGGGLNGVAGAVNGLGCTLNGRLFHVLPGFLPVLEARDEDLATYLDRVTPPKPKMERVASPWLKRPCHVISLLKAWYGDAAKQDNEFCWGYLPKISANYSWIPLFEAMDEGVIKGLICWGMNPAVSGPNSEFTRKALEKLDWMVVVDLWETETAAVWKRPGVDPKNSGTEVFLLPAATSLEEEGSVTSSARWMQWRYKVIDPPGQAKSDLWIIDKLMLKLKELYAAEGGPNAEAITKLTWDYGVPPNVHEVAKEINGYDLTTGKLLPSFGNLKDDGTTSSGNWIFCGSYTEDGNQAARRDISSDPHEIGLYPKWAWCWPLNRRIMYNRASVDLNGEPWDEDQPVIEWDLTAERWVGDVPDGGPPPGAIYPFVMKPEGRALLFGKGLADGPFPEHYEPWESPVENPMSPIQNDPVMKVWETWAEDIPQKYPIIATTFRVVEHMHTGTVTRNLPWLVECMPEMFVEVSEELAEEKGIINGGKVIIESDRGEISAVAVVTKRLQPLNINGQNVNQIGLPWNWGYMGLSKGDSANLLSPRVADANTGIPEFKVFLCDIRKA